MKLYDGLGPNPRVVRMFLAELGMEVETVTVDIMAGENRQEGHLNKNPMGQLPTLELDDGSFIAEITAICEYLDDIEGSTNLIGTSPKEKLHDVLHTKINGPKATTDAAFKTGSVLIEEGYAYFKFDKFFDRLKAKDWILSPGVIF